MTELEAWNWLNNQKNFTLTKELTKYRLYCRKSVVKGESVLDCVIKMKKKLNA